jgi:predicted dienelactone hydrolase
MRIFEILTLGTLFLALVARFFPEAKRPSWVNYFPGAAGLFILIHLVIEGYRWQMLPAYSLAFLLLVLSVPRLLGKRVNSPVGRRRSILNGIGTALGLVVIVIAAALSALLPVFKMPNPTGQYAVGTTSFAFTDESRPEIYTPDPTDKRLVYVQAWYPTGLTKDSARTPMWIIPEKVAPVVVKSLLGMPGFLFDHLALVKSNSYLNAPLTELEPAYPVLLFSHGHAEGFIAQNMVQMEELASHGYVIFSVGHAYESSLVLDAQGQAIQMSKTQVDAFNQENLETNGAYR